MTTPDRLLRAKSLRPVLITGAPGVGKSSVANLIAHRFSLAAHIDADELQKMIVSGGVWPSAATEAAVRQLVLRTSNVALLASSFLLAGVLPIIDEVVGTTEQFQVLERHLGEHRLLIVGLAAPYAVLLERDAGRAKTTAANYPGTEDKIRRTCRDAITWIDSSELSLDETVADVLELVLGELDFE